MAVAATLVLASTALAQDIIIQKQVVGSAFGQVITDPSAADGFVFLGSTGGQAIASDPMDYDATGKYTHGFWAPFYDWFTSVEEDEPFVAKNPLKVNNYPNPFKDQTTIAFELESASYVSLRVYDINGNMVADLYSDAVLSSGEYTKTWNGKDLRNGDLASGSYLYELNVKPQNGGRTISVRNIMVLNK